MAIDNRLQVFNEEGQSVDYDILASDVKFLPDGKDLPTKLAEMEQEIEEAGSGDGTVTGVKVGSTTYEPTEGVVDLSTPFAGKVDKNGTDSLMTAAEHTKLQNLPTADELTQQFGNKANDADVVKGINDSNGNALPKNQNGVITLPAAQAGGLTEEDISVETLGDGTVDINVGSDTYKINLNHTHENMAKLVVCEESGLPSTLANDTIYAQVDDAEDPSEIEKLWIAGLEFVGGGNTAPRLISPRNGITLDFDGGSTMQVTVRGANLSAALSLAVTGDFTVTANGSSVSTISASDAENGVTLTLTKGNNFTTGTLAISSSTSEFDTVTVNVVDSQLYQSLTAVKFTGSQWIDTGYTPGPNTRFEFDCMFEPNSVTSGSNSTNNNCAFLRANSGDEMFIFQTGYGDITLYSLMIYTTSSNAMVQHQYGESTMKNVRGTIAYSNGACTYLEYTLTPPTKSKLSPDTLKIAYNPAKTQKTFDVFNLYVYGFKIYDNNTLVRDYKPMSFNGVAGLYDEVNDVFYTSETAKTSGLSSDELVAIS